MAVVDHKTRGLNRTQDGESPFHAPNYKPGRQMKAVTQLIRLQICEQMIEDAPKFRYRGKFHLKRWIDNYAIYDHHRNKEALQAIGTIPYNTLRWWWQSIAKDDAAMASLRASIDSHPTNERKKRCRHSWNRNKWGETPFAERIVCGLRDRAVRVSADHGVSWCAHEYNRVLETPWYFLVAQRYIDEVEAKGWKERGRVAKEHIRKMQVYTQ